MRLRITAKGRNNQPLQERFYAILREAELKLLDATIEALAQDEQLYKERCTSEKVKITTAIEAWRTSFQAIEASLSIDTDHFVSLAKCFVNNFYFQCAIRTSKQVAGNMKKAAKEAKREQRMETEFHPNEQSIKDMVSREVQKEVSKFQTAKSKQSSGNSAGSKGRRKNCRSTSISKNQAKTGQNSSGAVPQGRPSRSRIRKTSRQQRHGVTFSGNCFLTFYHGIWNFIISLIVLSA